MFFVVGWTIFAPFSDSFNGIVEEWKTWPFLGDRIDIRAGVLGRADGTVAGLDVGAPPPPPLPPPHETPAIATIASAHPIDRDLGLLISAPFTE
jgi:hypothetical protein